MQESVERLFSLVCHQNPARCFVMGGEALPFCHRCAGVYTGIVMMSLFFTLRVRRSPGPLPRPLFCLNLVILAVMLVSGLHVVEMSAAGRFVIGALFGSALASAVWPVFLGTVAGRTLRPWGLQDGILYLLMLALASSLVWLAEGDGVVCRWFFIAVGCSGLTVGIILPNTVLVWWAGARRLRLGLGTAVWAMAAMLAGLELLALGVL